MTFREFEQTMGLFPLFSLQDIMLADPTFQRRNLPKWQNKGLIHKMRRGQYVFTHTQYHGDLYLFAVANKIIEPSYISLETALSYYQLIPDTIYTITSVTSDKTQRLDTTLGRFHYQTIPPSALTGYTTIKYENIPISMAHKEKAIIDYLYLHPRVNTAGAMHELRINTDELFKNFNQELFLTYGRVFENKKLMQRAQLFLEYWRNPTYAHY